MLYYLSMEMFAGIVLSCTCMALSDLKCLIRIRYLLNRTIMWLYRLYRRYLTWKEDLISRDILILVLLERGFPLGWDIAKKNNLWKFSSQIPEKVLE